jgi:Tfp pilus assembly protein FimV
MSLRLALSAALLVPGLVAAAELGRLTVFSGVGEPLHAEIEIVAVQPGEAAALGARIPPADVFWRANLEPAPVIDALRVAVERRPQARYVVAVRSSSPVADPFIQLLVELTSPAGSVVREYPFLLEEPGVRRPRPATASPALPAGTPSLPSVGAGARERAAPASPRPPGDRLRLSGGASAKAGGAAAKTAREDDLAALHHALGETKERVAALEKSVGEITTLITLKKREPGGVERDARATGQTSVGSSGDAATAAAAAGARERPALPPLFDGYRAWLIAALLAGFVSWIAMPVKTLRLWLKKRRYRLRKARRAAERVRRAARNAGLLPSSV